MTKRRDGALRLGQLDGWRMRATVAMLRSPDYPNLPRPAPALLEVQADDGEDRSSKAKRVAHCAAMHFRALSQLIYFDI